MGFESPAFRHGLPGARGAPTQRNNQALATCTRSIKVAHASPVTRRRSTEGANTVPQRVVACFSAEIFPRASTQSG